VTLRFATVDDAQALAVIHASAFDAPWDARQIASLLGDPGVFGQLAECGQEPTGFILGRVAADEAEILTLAMATTQRRRGLGASLLAAAAATARARGALAIFLEVASDNRPALGLYRKFGFAVVGARARYYDHEGGGDALVLRLDLNSCLPPPYHHGRASK